MVARFVNVPVVGIDTADTYQPSLDNLNPNPFIDQLMDDTWMDFQQNCKSNELYYYHIADYFEVSCIG